MKSRLNYCGLLAGAALACALLAAPAHAQERIKFKAIGQPLATGLIQKNKEQPFFENFAERTGLPIDVDYKPIDTLGLKDTEQLRVMKAGLFDIVSLRVSQNSRDEPTLLGLDLVGASPDYATGRKVSRPTSRPSTTPAEAVQRQAAGRVALRPADPVLQEADRQARRHQGHEGPRVRPEPGQVHRDGGRHAGAGLLRRHAPVAVARRRRLRHHRPELGQLRRLARSDDAPAAAGLPDGAERLRHDAQGLEPAQARPAGQAADALRQADR